jgi:hypothetical protein
MWLAITTLGRLRQQTTLSNLPQSLRRRTLLVCQHHEVDAHWRAHRPACADVLALPEWVDNLGPTRQWLAEEFWGQKYVLLDDDLTLYRRQQRDHWHLVECTDRDAEEMFEEIEQKLDDYAHVGVAGREGHNHARGYGVECVRYMRILAYNSRLWPAHVRSDRVSGMSDFDVNLQLLRAGLPSYVFSRYGQGQGSTQAPGGCALNRTHETHDREVDLLVAMHPGLVRKVRKQNRSGGEFGDRSEVVVSWKMALGHDLRCPAEGAGVAAAGAAG